MDFDNIKKFFIGDREIKTLYINNRPVWQSLETYVVDFYSDQLLKKSETVESGKDAHPPSLTKTGYIQNGWDNSYTNITRNTVCNAIWNPITYYITFNSNDGQGNMNDMTCDYDKTYSLLKNQFVKSNNRFDGWNGSNGIEYVDEASVVNLTTQNGGRITMTAKWVYTGPQTIFEKDGSNGTISETLTLTPGYYRITMCGAGGGRWTNKDQAVCITIPVYIGGGSGAGFYGIVNIENQQDINVKVGQIGANTSFGTLVCGCGNGINVGTITVPKTGVIIYSYVISKAGNAGEQDVSDNDPRGGASVLKYQQINDLFPKINLDWGAGGNWTTGLSPNPKAGYLKIEKMEI